MLFTTLQLLQLKRQLMQRAARTGQSLQSCFVACPEKLFVSFWGPASFGVQLCLLWYAVCCPISGEPPFDLLDAAQHLEDLAYGAYERHPPLPIDRLSFCQKQHLCRVIVVWGCPPKRVKYVETVSPIWLRYQVSCGSPFRFLIAPGPRVGTGVPAPHRGVNLDPAP